MDEFIDDIVAAIQDHGARAVRVFPPASHVLIYFSDRLANDVVGTITLISLPTSAYSSLQVSDYTFTLLSHAREISTTTYLKSVAASFREAWRMVDAITEVAKQRSDFKLQKTIVEDVV